MPNDPASVARLNQEWRAAQGEIDHLEATTPALGVRLRGQEKVEELFAALQAETRRLRRVPASGVKVSETPDRAALLERARERLRQAEALIDEMAEWSASAKANADEWEQRAMLAVHAEADDLALEALERRRESMREHEPLQREVDAGRAVLAEMRAVLEAMGNEGT